MHPEASPGEKGWVPWILGQLDKNHIWELQGVKLLDVFFFLHFKMQDVLVSRFGRWSKLEAKKGILFRWDQSRFNTVIWVFWQRFDEVFGGRSYDLQMGQEVAKFWDLVWGERLESSPKNQSLLRGSVFHTQKVVVHHFPANHEARAATENRSFNQAD